MFAASAARDAPPAQLGRILLRPDQVETVRTVRLQLRRDGGCLLADEVGSGKTYVALAVAREWTRPLVVAPASLRATWEQAAGRADVHVRLISHEALSRGHVPNESFDGIIVDESHRFRATTHRYDALARLAAYAPLLMLSATPIQNDARELAGQLALFLGESALGLDPEALARWVVRSSDTAAIALPRVAPPRWIALDAEDGAVLRAILALPPPPRAADVGDGGVLLQLSLVRAWASSRAALTASVRRRRRTLDAIEQCHAEGRLPTTRELRSWTGGGGVQLGFPSLLAAATIERTRAEALTEAIARERVALEQLMWTIERGADPDVARVAALCALRATHAGASILAFSEWASTVRAYWSLLRGEAGVGMLTAREARIASGPLPRDDLLARFAPRGQGAPRPPERERVTLLLATDLLSEGVNLQDASVVVHLDLPWNPARLAQRVGRIRRPGGAREVCSYLMSPPARASLLLRVEARLRAKLERAERTIGRSIAVLPALTAVPEEHGIDDSPASPTNEGLPSLSAAELRGAIVRRLTGWHRAESESERLDDGLVAIAAASAEITGWIALLDDGRLIALIDSGDAPARASDHPELTLRALTSASGAPRDVSPLECEAALAALHQWLSLDWTRRSCGLASVDSALRRRVLRALDDAMRAAPRHHRSSLLRWVAEVRRALTLPLPLGLERALETVAMEGGAAHGWIETAAALVARAPARERGPDGRATVRALILLG